MKVRKLDPKRKIFIKIDKKQKVEFRLGQVMVPAGKNISLKKDYDPEFTGGFDDKAGALEKVSANVERLAEMQERLYAQDTYSLLLIFQAMDAAGKDGVIRHVMSGVNPQGCHVTSFKAPSSEELDHDYLWRSAKAIPERGMIGIFNRSHYEEVLAVRVHPEFLESQKLPKDNLKKGIWERRFTEINNFERYLRENGVIIVKFFLNLSKKEQKKRFLSRINETEKNWKFSVADYRERLLWDKYQDSFEDMLNQTSTPWAPWFVVPADNKWFARLVVSEAICRVMEALDLKFPKVSKERLKELLMIKKSLEDE